MAKKKANEIILVLSKDELEYLIEEMNKVEESYYGNGDGYTNLEVRFYKDMTRKLVGDYTLEEHIEQEI